MEVRIIEEVYYRNKRKVVEAEGALDSVRELLKFKHYDAVRACFKDKTIIRKSTIHHLKDLAINVSSYNGLDIGVSAFYLMDIKGHDDASKKLIRSAKGWVSTNHSVYTNVPDKYKGLIVRLHYSLIRDNPFVFDYNFNIV